MHPSMFMLEIFIGFRDSLNEETLPVNQNAQFTELFSLLFLKHFTFSHCMASAVWSCIDKTLPEAQRTQKLTP